MRIKTHNCCTVLLANYNAKLFKEAEHVVAVAQCELLGPLVRVCGVAFAAVACVVCLLGCCCSAVLHKLYFIVAETLTLLT